MIHNDCDSVALHYQRVKLMDGHFVPPTTASPAGAAAKQPATPFVTLKSIFEQLGVAHDLSKKQTDGFLTDFLVAMTSHLQSGTRIRMSGFGTLELRHSAARTGRSPATGEAIEIKASKRVAFRAAKELKETV